MTALTLVLFIVASGLSIALPLISKLMDDAERKRKLKTNLLLTIGCVVFLTTTCVQILTYYQNRALRKTATQNEQLLRNQIVELRQQNRALLDQVANSNAQLSALREKLHAPAQFTVTMREDLATEASAAADEHVPNSHLPLILPAQIVR
jgi:type II secretory pathway pseudopilin PulG